MLDGGKEQQMKRRTLFTSLLTVALFATAGFVSAARASTPTAAAPIDPANFVKTIDNPYFPLTPGTVMIYEGDADGAPARVETTVSTESKTIMGVECVEVRDVAYEDGEIVEDTLDWYAQDKDGNVWYFGEATQAIEDGKVTSTEGSWEAGVDGAQPGIIMQAHPKIGEQYQQEFAPGVAEDMAEVLRLGEKVTVQFSSFSDVLVTKDWNPLDPGTVEEKSYAPGVGLILEVAVQGESERLELVEVTTSGATPTP
jgi:hypothetical protein